MSTVAQISIAEYDRMISNGVFDGRNRRRIELIQGELRMMSPIGPSHEVAVDILNEWSFEVAPLDLLWVRIQNSIGLPALITVPEPDVAWVRRRSYRKGRPTAADVLLLIEVADSSLDYDRGEKAMLYAKARIADYWIVNLVDGCVEVLREPQRGRYRSIETFESGEKVRPLALPKIDLPVARLFTA